jgi:rhodanese-related sulfurtransferase
MENNMKTALLFLTLIFLLPFSGFGSEVKTIDKDGLKGLLSSDNVVVLDVRTGSDWSASDYKIKGAVRVEPGEVSSWAGSYPKDKTYVLYCA